MELASRPQALKLRKSRRIMAKKTLKKAKKLEQTKALIVLR